MHSKVYYRLFTSTIIHKSTNYIVKALCGSQLFFMHSRGPRISLILFCLLYCMPILKTATLLAICTWSCFHKSSLSLTSKGFNNPFTTVSYISYQTRLLRRQLFLQRFSPPLSGKQWLSLSSHHIKDFFFSANLAQAIACTQSCLSRLSASLLPVVVKGIFRLFRIFRSFHPSLWMPTITLWAFTFNFLIHTFPDSCTVLYLKILP